MQSANIETDYGENEKANSEETRGDNNFFISSFRYNNKVNKNKYSHSLRKDFNRIGEINDESLHFLDDRKEKDDEVDSFDLKDKE